MALYVCIIWGVIISQNVPTNVGFSNCYIRLGPFGVSRNQTIRRELARGSGLLLSYVASSSSLCFYIPIFGEITVIFNILKVC